MTIASLTEAIMVVSAKVPDTVHYMYLGYGAIALILGGYSIYLCLAFRKQRKG